LEGDAILDCLLGDGRFTFVVVVELWSCFCCWLLLRRRCCWLFLARRLTARLLTAATEAALAATWLVAGELVEVDEAGGDGDGDDGDDDDDDAAARSSETEEEAEAAIGPVKPRIRRRAPVPAAQ